MVGQERDKWLAEAFPALTGAAGGPEGMGLNGTLNPNNVQDMQMEFTNGWPQERIDKGDMRWKHSDLRNVSYLYLFKIFENMVNP